MSDSAEFDYVVVGGGSAGCVLASRLSEDPRVSVLLLEAGPDSEPFWVRTPAGVGHLYFDQRVNWRFSTEPEPGLSGRRIYCPRGKIIGGSSAINGMLYIRGFPIDYDRWDQLGNRGWSWKDVLPFFRRSESCTSPASAYRGLDGPLKVSSPYAQCAVTHAFVRAGVELGLTRNADLAGALQEGVGYAQHTIGDGVRSSTARAYLTAARTRANLSIVGRALAMRVRVKDGAATGVEYELGGMLRTAAARKEVILSAGVFGSPLLLMHSGVGEPHHLRAHGIAVVHPSPGVGANLQDHLGINAGYKVRAGYSLNAQLSGWRKYVHGLSYLMSRSGPLSVGVSHAVAFARSRPELDGPDIQITFRPMSLAFDSTRRLRMHGFPGIQITGAMLRPASRGRVLLRSADPRDAPLISGNFLSDPDDERVMLSIVRWIRHFASTRPLADLIVREDLPGAQVVSDDDLLSFIRSRSETIYHPVGTCRMGPDAHAVVDERLRVRGLRALRVVDASVMPLIPSGNTNAPTIMIAEKAASMILEDAACASPSPLAPAPCPLQDLG